MKKIVGKKGAAVRRSAINIGDIVQIRFGTGDVKGRVVENRGHIGFKGRNLYRIVVTMEGEEPMSIELPAEEIQVVRRAPAAKKPARPGARRVPKVRVKPKAVGKQEPIKA